MKRLPRIVALVIAPVIVLGAAIAAGGCTGAPVTSPASAPMRIPADDRLFQALGGHAGIEALSESFVRELAADEVTRAFFARTDIARFHRLIQEQLCAESGGGCTYTGESMRVVHAGLGIERRDMNAVVEALMRAMDRQGLPVATQNAVLAMHAPKRADVLGE